MKFVIFVLFLSISTCYSTSHFRTGKGHEYKPDWNDLDTRPLPKWYDQAKIGIFLHWGVFSVPSFGNEWFWFRWKSQSTAYVEFMKSNYPPGFTYQDFASQFTTEFFDPTKWAKLFAKAGAQYVILTSKHHDGYTLFPSKRSFSWNSVDVGPRRDIVAELSQAVRTEGLKFGVYHSLFEWYNPIYLEDKSEFYSTRNYPNTKLIPDLKQLVEDYKPSVIWSDGDWEALDAYWNSTDFLAWLYNESPVSNEVVVNDRWGIGISCHHGDFWTCSDKYNPGTLQPHKWENAFTLDRNSWGYRRDIELNEVLTIEEILYQIVSTVSCGGNVNINIGPTKEGTIAPIFQDRLLALGEWLSINGEAIYKTSPWLHQNDTVNGDVWYTCTKHGYNGYHPTKKPRKSDKVTAVYALVLKWPKDNVLRIHDTTTMLHSGNYKIEMLGQDNNYLDWKIENGVTNIQFPNRETINSVHVWCLRLTSK